MGRAEQRRRCTTTQVVWRYVFGVWCCHGSGDYAEVYDRLWDGKEHNKEETIEMLNQVLNIPGPATGTDGSRSKVQRTERWL